MPGSLSQPANATNQHGRTLLLTRHYAPEPIGSAPVIQEVAEWLARQQHAVDVITVRPNYPYAEVFEGYEKGQKDAAMERGVTILRKPTIVMKGGGIRARLVPEVEFALRLWIESFRLNRRRYESVISLCPSVMTVLAARCFANPDSRHIAVVHDIQSGLAGALGITSGMRAKGLSVLKWLERKALSQADYIVCLSEQMESQLRSLGVTRPIIVLPPHVDTDTVVPHPESADAPFTVMYSGNLGRKQGLETLVRLAGILERDAPRIRVLIRGNGNMEGWLAEQIRFKKLTNTRLEPLAPASELSKSLADGHVHLVPQDPSGANFAVPSKVFSLMAAGRPFICLANADSPLANLSDETGGAYEWVTPGDDEALAKRVVSLSQDPEKRLEMSQRGRRYAVENASTNVVMKKLEKVIWPQSVHPTQAANQTPRVFGQEQNG